MLLGDTKQNKESLVYEESNLFFRIKTNLIPSGRCVFLHDNWIRQTSEIQQQDSVASLFSANVTTQPSAN
jgi:hypothetical protein